MIRLDDEEENPGAQSYQRGMMLMIYIYIYIYLRNVCVSVYVFVMDSPNDLILCGPNCSVKDMNC